MGREGSLNLRFAVLGPVRAWRGEVPLNLGAPQQLAVLGALLLRGGRTITSGELVDAVWGDEPPNSALATLRTYAFRLRKVLGANALASVAGGYAMQMDSGALDLAVCERLAAEAEKLRASGEPARARELLREALDAFAGEPLAGVPGPYAESQRNRLSEWRLTLLEWRLELDLELGGHAEAVSELTALSAEYPVRERLRALLMLALYRGGRQAEALGVFADTRRLLGDELGVDPGPELTELHQRVLEADPALIPSPPPLVAVTSAADDRERPAPRPAQLPAPVSDFTGRTAFVKELSDQLASAEGGRVMAVSAVAGIGGVGKTTLAVHVAHAAREHFPDGQLYVDLMGAGPSPAEPEVVLGAFLRALGTPDSAIPEGLEERAGLYRSLLAGRRVLALLDDARDSAQVRRLLPGSPGCAVLITSRSRMIDLAGAHLVDLDVMSPDEALALFTRIVGADRVGGEQRAALDVVAACGFLPLAIRIAASRLANRRTWTVALLASKLADERRRLDELRAGELAVTATFELGYGQLEADQARAFRLLALSEGPDISLAAAAALLDLDPYTVEEILESLVDTSLLESAAPGRYRYHDLLRLYARSRAEQDQSPVERQDALARLLDFYLATAAHTYHRENPGDRLLDHLTPTHHPGIAFDHDEAALDWLFTEAPCLLATVSHTATDSRLLRPAVDLLLVVQDLMESGAFARSYELATRAVIEAAHQVGDARCEARARALLGQSHCMSGRFDEANEEARRAHMLGITARDQLMACYAPNLLGITALYQNRFEDAHECFTLALNAFRTDGNRLGEASVLSNLSRVRLSLGQATSAVAAAEQALGLHRDIGGATLRLGNGLYALGMALTRAGRHQEALARLTEALEIHRGARQRLWEGMTVFRIAEVLLTAGRPADAAAHAEQALSLLRDIGGEWRRAQVLTSLGHALTRIGQADRARGCWQEAYALYDRVAAPEVAQLRALLDDDERGAVTL
ncbi:regulator [Wenjunlia vitaminophila]|uniref:Regulator n=1 Tax=Wenjunlia vitaminophila TaxID=76728 RepID=A0A0T6LW10_WENVI|nr:BTAD domain-containing putative transcriptional regulator [Wenjunlia vitaminophila]KRV50034.1 regulator [Wenjunlia vitaminophila]